MYVLWCSCNLLLALVSVISILMSLQNPRTLNTFPLCKNNINKIDIQKYRTRIPGYKVKKLNTQNQQIECINIKHLGGKEGGGILGSWFVKV